VWLADIVAAAQADAEAAAAAAAQSQSHARHAAAAHSEPLPPLPPAWLQSAVAWLDNAADWLRGGSASSMTGMGAPALSTAAVSRPLVDARQLADLSTRLLLAAARRVGVPPPAAATPSVPSAEASGEGEGGGGGGGGARDMPAAGTTTTASAPAASQLTLDEMLRLATRLHAAVNNDGGGSGGGSDASAALGGLSRAVASRVGRTNAQVCVEAAATLSSLLPPPPTPAQLAVAVQTDAWATAADRDGSDNGWSPHHAASAPGEGGAASSSRDGAGYQEVRRVVAQLCAAALEDDRPSADWLRPHQLVRVLDLAATAGSGGSDVDRSLRAVLSTRALPRLTEWFENGGGGGGSSSGLPTSRLWERPAVAVLLSLGRLRLAPPPELSCALADTITSARNDLSRASRLSALAGVALLATVPHPLTVRDPAMAALAATLAKAAGNDTDTASADLTHLAPACLLAHHLYTHQQTNPGRHGQPYAAAASRLASDVSGALVQLGPEATLQLVGVLQAHGHGLPVANAGPRRPPPPAGAGSQQHPLRSLLTALLSQAREGQQQKQQQAERLAQKEAQQHQGQQQQVQAQWAQAQQQQQEEEAPAPQPRGQAWPLPGAVLRLLALSTRHPDALHWDTGCADAVVGWVVASLEAWPPEQAGELGQVLRSLALLAAGGQHAPGSSATGSSGGPGVDTAWLDLLTEQVYASVRTSLEPRMAATSSLTAIAYAAETLDSSGAPPRERARLASFLQVTA
jgi:hypothetical protein